MPREVFTPENVLLSMDGLIHKCEQVPESLDYLLTLRSILNQMQARVGAAIKRQKQRRAESGADA